ncbi:MAG: zf-HC2 domain-containing protein [Clostridia bacterium]|nr:zf-HC2 domain-containing protein [Deltaproteobacteria bacterium]
MSQPNISRDQAMDMLTDYFEQRLSPDLRRAVEAHIAKDTVLKHVLETYKKTVVLCRESLKQHESPVGFGPRLLGYLRQHAVEGIEQQKAIGRGTH